MTQLVLWVAICVAIAWFTRNRAIVSIVLVLTLWVAVPGVASSVVTGQPRGSSLAYHPATWLIVVTLVIQVVHHHDRVGPEIARRILVYLGLVLFLAVAFLTSVVSQSGGLVLFFSQMVGPVALFYLICAEVHSKPSTLFVVRNWLIFFAAAQSIVALVEWSIGGVVLYREQYALNYWFHEDANTRWMGTLDHPLTLSLTVCAAAPLLAGIRRPLVQLPLLLVMCGGVLASQSRTGLGVIAVTSIYVVLASRASTGVKGLSLGALAAAGLYAANSALSSGVADRLAYDSGSSEARGDALDFFFSNAGRFALSGGGIGSARQVAEYGGLITSLESSFLIYAVDLGILVTVIYFGSQVWIVLRSFGPSMCPGLWLSGLVVVVMPQTYNALNSQTFAGVLIWTVLALAASMTSLRVPSGPKQQDTPVGQRLL